MFDALFQALFSYRPVVFQQGEFRFDLTGASLFAAGLVAVVGGARRLHLPPRAGHRGPSPGSRHPDRACAWPCWASCCSACSARRSSCAPPSTSRTSSPCCSTTRAACRFPTWRGSRADSTCATSSAPPTSPLLKSLGDRFLVRVFRFSSAASRRAVGEGAVASTGSQTKLGAAFDGVREELARPARGRRRAGVGRRRHQRVVAVGGAARSQGREAAGLCRGRRQRGAARDIQVDRVTRAAHRAQGRVAAASTSW